ncbi:hypothetical protein [Thermococcus sp.]|uniref:hypothetical protein n=1 Tax=Thermococcus sp. TaxID=35749 RepID=UPI0026270137|nr:hypothetical protein [Thermococcus sp.]
MGEIPVAIYDTQGILVSGGGVNFEELGISYGDMDSLGVWLALRRGEDFVVGMRIDHLYENRGLGRDNRYLVLIKFPAEKFPSFVERFQDLMKKLIADFEESNNVAYKGEFGEKPYLNPAVAEKIATLVEKLPKYDEETLRKYGLAKDRLRVRVEGLNYDDPSIGDRAAALELIQRILYTAPESPITELLVFSKGSSAKYPGLWMEKDAKPPEEILSALEGEFERLKELYEECDRERLRYQRDLEKCRDDLESSKAEARRYRRLYESSSKGIARPIVAGISIILLLAGLFAGAYLHSSGVMPLLPKPAKVIPPADNGYLKANSGLKGEPAKVIGGYIKFIKEAKNGRVDLAYLSSLVVNDSKLHRECLANQSKLKDETKKLTARVNTLENELKKANSTILALREEKNKLKSQLDGFSKDTKCFSTLVGPNVTLTEDDLQTLSKEPGIGGWEKVMTGHCRAKLNEMRENLHSESVHFQNVLNDSLNDLRQAQKVSMKILLNPISEPVKGYMINFTRAINASIEETMLIERITQNHTEKLKSFNVSSVKSCSGACKVMGEWTAEQGRIKRALEKNFTKIPAVVVMEDLQELYNTNKTISDPGKLNTLNVSAYTKGLLGYVLNLPANVALTPKDFWREVGNLTGDLSGVGKPEDVRLYLERLLKLLEFIDSKVEAS